MLVRASLIALANQLRHARTRLLPLELAERLQHALVRVEELLASPVADAAAFEAITAHAQQLLAEYEALQPKG